MTRSTTGGGGDAEAMAAVVDAGGRGTPVTASEIADELGCVRRTAYDRLTTLADRGALETKKVGARGRVWWLPARAGSAEDGPTDGLAAAPDDRRGELARLNRVNSVIRGILTDLVAADGREEIEAAACTRLADSEPYLFAVVGEFDAEYTRYTPRAWAGVGEGYLAALDDDRAPALDRSPGAEAARTGEVQITQDLAEFSHDYWREVSDLYGYRSYAAVPLSYRDVVYGVLSVYADRPRVFDERERRVLAELGEAVGHAINALERKRALLTDRVVELEFRSRALAEPFAGLGDGEFHMSYRGWQLLDDGTHVMAFTADDVAPERCAELLGKFPNIEGVTLLNRSPDGGQLTFHTTDETLSDHVAARGGRIAELRVTEGEYRATVEVPERVGVRRLRSALRETYADLELVAQRPRERRTLPVTAFGTRVEEALTERQRTALELAYYAGYFEWPRGTTGGGLAETMGIAPQTFYQHLRVAQRNLLEAVFESERPDDEQSADG